MAASTQRGSWWTMNGLARWSESRMMENNSTSGGHMASKDKGGKSVKKQPKKNLKEKRAAKKQKKEK
jgi:hypothetical protein